jgi:hypothetical protein
VDGIATFSHSNVKAKKFVSGYRIELWLLKLGRVGKEGEKEFK